MLTPFYESDRTLIFCGDCRIVLREWSEPVAAIVLDAPHFGSDYQHDLEDGSRAWRSDEMAQWLLLQLEFFHGWIALCHDHVGEGPMWVHLNLHHVFAFQSVAYWERWQAQRTWQLSAEEALVCCCQLGKLTERATTAIQTQRHLNRYNQQKPVAWITELLKLSPDGPVLDPMMGTGSTLLAALAMGRRAIGIDLREDLCQETVRRIQQMERGAA